MCIYTYDIYSYTNKVLNKKKLIKMSSNSIEIKIKMQNYAFEHCCITKSDFVHGRFVYLIPRPGSRKNLILPWPLIVRTEIRFIKIAHSAPKKYNN